MTKSKKTIRDPFAENEAKKYANPIPSREYIIQHLQQAAEPLTFNQVADALHINEEQIEALTRRLKAMLRDGQLMQNRRGAYGLITKMDLHRGKVSAHRDGHGYVILDETQEKVYLSPKQMSIVFNGDHVLIRKIESDYHELASGIIIEILQRGIKKFVGQLFSEEGAIFLAAQNKGVYRDILIPPNDLNGAKAGQIVAVECVIPSVPNIRRAPVGRIIEVLGEHLAPGMEIEVAIRAHALPHQWPEAVLKEAQNFPTRVAPTAKEDRADLRELDFITIDGEDARDYDDAVFAKQNSKHNFTLYVAIADVSHYVSINSALDKEAYLRGNSVYFPNRVIPMLPEALSNELCSLKPKVDRLAMVCEANIDQKGKVTRYRFYRAVIKSKARMTYKQVSNMIEGTEKPNQYFPTIQALHNLTTILATVRAKRGSIDFEFPEPYIIFDDNHKIEKIVARERNIAHHLIEECMLVANVCAAEYLEKNQMPALFRIHDQPSIEKIHDVRKFLQEHGIKLAGGKDPEPKHFANVMAKIKDRDDFAMLQMTILRTMTQATYSGENHGHFALAYPAYAHFTSPIRRYPDLIVHRAIGAVLDRRKKQYPYSFEQMTEFGEHCSQTERRADYASWDVIAWLKCEFMQDKLGQVFDGHISSVTAFGIFIELREFFVDGLVHITALKNDYYHFDPIRYQLKGERTNTIYKIGDPLQIRVARVDLEKKQIDFEIVTNEQESLPQRPKKKSTYKKKRKQRR